MTARTTHILDDGMVEGTQAQAGRLSGVSKRQVAVAIGLGGIVLLVMLCNIAGITAWVAIGVMAAIFVITISLTWMVVNGGLLLVQAPLFPSEYLEVPLGTLRIGARSLTVLSFQRAFLRDWGELLMPSIMHGFKIPDYIKLNQRKLLAIMAISIVVAIAAIRA